MSEMRARSLLAVFALFASACTFLFPLDGIVPAEPSDGGADAASALDGASSDGASDAPMDASADGPRTGYVGEVLADTPVMYLRLGEKSGMSAFDQRGQPPGIYGSKVALGAPGAIKDDPDTAATFNGLVGSAISIPGGHLDFPGKLPFSVEVWALQTTPNQYGWAVDHQVYNGGTDRESWSLRFSMDLIAFERWANNVSSGVAAPLTVFRDAGAGKPQVYHHVVGTFDGTDVAIYVDGQPVASAPSSASMHPMATYWSLGAQNCTCGSSDFIGSLDELAIYDKALSPARVLAHYHASGR